MIILWKEVKKIINQILGTQNIFGYKSTVANQMYLLYCLSGKIFFTNEMNTRIKYLWYILTFCEVATFYILALVYFLYDKEHDIMMILNDVVLVGCTNITSLGLPIIVIILGDQIETMIKHVDLILTNPSRVDQMVLKNSMQNRILVDMKEAFVSRMGPYVVCILTFMFICFFDVVLFFSEDKVKNNFYYISPISGIKEHGTFGSFLFFNGISTFAFGMVFIKAAAFISIVLYWNVVCCGVLIDIGDEIDNQAANLMEEMEKGAGVIKNVDEWNQNFNKVVRYGNGRFQKTILLVNYLRTLIEVMTSMFTTAGFFYGIALLYICSSADVVFVLKLKYLGLYLATVFGILLLYSIGEDLNHSVGELSLTLYSTPWYWSPEVRKNVYLLLWQTQTIKELKLMKVYGLMLKNFSKYMNGVFSYTNILRRLTMK